MEKHFIGIDISKDTFDVCVLDRDHQTVLRHRMYSNDTKGIQAFIKDADCHFQDVWVCMEHTGHYAALLIRELTAHQVKLSLVNPLEVKRSAGMVRGKDDKVDAYRIASYLLRNAFKLKPYKPCSESLAKLKVKLGLREFYVKMVVQCKNNIKSLEVLARSQDVAQEINTLRSSLAGHQEVIQDLEKQMVEIIDADLEIKHTYQQIRSVDGIGFVVAATCIVETDNFTSFTDARKFSCHAGLAPFPYQSGTSVRGRARTSRLRKASLKALLIRAGMTAGHYDPQLRAFKQRKLDEGKHKMVVNVALANKVIARMFAVAKRQQPYIKFAA